MYTGMGDLTQQQAAATVGGSLLATAKFTGPAAPFVAAAGALADIVSLFGPNPYNTYTTEVVNRVEADVMKPNLEAWQALPDDEKTVANQQAALANFESGWNYVVNACTNPQLGSAGTNCIKDRDHGGKWDWFVYYYDPIANDPAVAANAANPLSAVSSFLPSGSMLPLFLIGGLLLLAVAD